MGVDSGSRRGKREWAYVNVLYACILTMYMHVWPTYESPHISEIYTLNTLMCAQLLSDSRRRFLDKGEEGSCLVFWSPDEERETKEEEQQKARKVSVDEECGKHWDADRPTAIGTGGKAARTFTAFFVFSFFSASLRLCLFVLCIFFILFSFSLYIGLFDSLVPWYIYIYFFFSLEMPLFVPC